MKRTSRTMFAGLILAATVVACKKDKSLVSLPPPVINEPEVITTMRLKFVDSSDNTNIKYATFRDPDGDGGAGFDIFDTIKLSPNKTWYTTVLLLNETKNPADTISNEVLEEAADHLLCFSPSGTSATISITDLDANNFPIGLQSKWKTTVVGTGFMQIELKHQPGIKNGSCALGDTDIDVNFKVKVQ
jgi:hypothetical protein